MKTQLPPILETKLADFRQRVWAVKLAEALLFCVFAVFSISAAIAEEISHGEKKKIEALLSLVEMSSDASFIRNGSEYDAKSATKFLRGKWQAHAKEIATAEDFIAKAATRSSTTGMPYIIRFKGEGDKPCADYLSEQLKKLASKSAPPR